MGIAFAFSFRLLSCLPESQCIIVAANLVDLFRSSLTRGLLMVWALQKPPVVATEKLLPSSGCFSILKHFKKVMNVLENQATNHWQVKKALCEFICRKWCCGQKKKVNPNTLHNETTSGCSLFQVGQVTVPVNCCHYEAEFFNADDKAIQTCAPWEALAICMAKQRPDLCLLAAGGGCFHQPHWSPDFIQVGFEDLLTKTHPKKRYSKRQ